MAASDHPALLGRLTGRREDLPDETHHRLLGWYADSIRKRMILDSGRYVGKNPAATTEVRELLALFPDATFVVMTRDSEAAIRSRQKLVQAVWDRFGRGQLDEHHLSYLRMDSERTCAGLGRIPPEVSIIEVRHDDVVRDLDGTVAWLKSQLGVGPSAALHRVKA